MKIGSPEHQAAVSSLSSDRTPAGSAKKAAGSAAASQDSATVALSSTAAELRNTPTDASFDAAKVERIAQAIRDGKFQVNPEKIADKLIANAQELLNRSSS